MINLISYLPLDIVKLIVDMLHYDDYCNFALACDIHIAKMPDISPIIINTIDKLSFARLILSTSRIKDVEYYGKSFLRQSRIDNNHIVPFSPRMIYNPNYKRNLLLMPRVTSICMPKSVLLYPRK